MMTHAFFCIRLFCEHRKMIAGVDWINAREKKSLQMGPPNEEVMLCSKLFQLCQFFIVFLHHWLIFDGIFHSTTKVTAAAKMEPPRLDQMRGFKAAAKAFEHIYELFKLDIVALFIFDSRNNEAVIAFLWHQHVQFHHWFVLQQFWHTTVVSLALPPLPLLLLPENTLFVLVLVAFFDLVFVWYLFRCRRRRWKEWSKQSGCTSLDPNGGNPRGSCWWTDQQRQEEVWWAMSS